ncbi:MAG: helix-hairpin-helix domain-containing protein [Candidatus Omnitrophica bacterium]|nr:helix-hairpin-helix domain-containing protein [Candidatus Omnitrophota bacterium]
MLKFVLITTAAGACLAGCFKAFPSLPRALGIMDNSSYRRKIDINKASYTELVGVSGIGPSSAGRIIAYREKTGGIKDIEELSHIKHLNPALVGKIKEYFYVP